MLLCVVVVFCVCECVCHGGAGVLFVHHRVMAVICTFHQNSVKCVEPSHSVEDRSISNHNRWQFYLSNESALKQVWQLSRDISHFNRGSTRGQQVTCRHRNRKAQRGRSLQLSKGRLFHTVRAASYTFHLKLLKCAATVCFWMIICKNITSNFNFSVIKVIKT